MAEHTPLLCQYFENISREALEKHQGNQGILQSFVAGRHGVYAWYRGERLDILALRARSTRRLGALEHITNMIPALRDHMAGC